MSSQSMILGRAHHRDDHLPRCWFLEPFVHRALVFCRKTGINDNQCLEGLEVGHFPVFAESYYCINLTVESIQAGTAFSVAEFLTLGRLEDIVHFTKQGKLEYYEGNFDAFRRRLDTTRWTNHAAWLWPMWPTGHRAASGGLGRPGKRPNWMLKVPRMLGVPTSWGEPEIHGDFVNLDSQKRIKKGCFRMSYAVIYAVI